jgi:hypothetical protein
MPILGTFGASSGKGFGLTETVKGVPYNIDILVVGGGGAGGSGDDGGGGGAAGLVYKTSHEITSKNTYNIVIGGGAASTVYPTRLGANGVDTTWTGKPTETVLTAKGGGGAGAGSEGGSDGGCGGGDGYGDYNGSPGGGRGSETQTGQAGDSGTYGFGYNGGDGAKHWPGPGWIYCPGGGGGAGGVGASVSGAAAGAGGAGKDLSTDFGSEGDSGWFASGGGGGDISAGSPGAASQGGGTSGAVNSSSAQANTGGASGGGGSPSHGYAGAGGSGVICLKVLTADYSGITTGSPNERVDGSYTIVEFTGTGSYKG